MEYGFSILMFCLAGGIFLFALGMPKSLDLMWQAHYESVKKDKRYMRGLKKVLYLVALAPAASGITALVPVFLGWDEGEGAVFFWIAGVVLVGGVALAIRVGYVRWIRGL